VTTTGGCSQALTEIARKAYYDYIIAQPGVVPSFVDVRVSCIVLVMGRAGMRHMPWFTQWIGKHSNHLATLLSPQGRRCFKSLFEGTQ
jgi:hypothetical protein